VFQRTLTALDCLPIEQPKQRAISKLSKLGER